MTTKKPTTRKPPTKAKTTTAPVRPWIDDIAGYAAAHRSALLDVVMADGLSRAAGFYRQHKPGRAEWELARLRLKVERLEYGHPAIDTIADQAYVTYTPRVPS